jgi:alpha-soluble NSF attachment protein
MAEYQRAAGFYKGDEQRSSAGKCLLKVASLAAELEQYQLAMHTFEEVAIYETDNQMLKYSAKTHFFQVCNAFFNTVAYCQSPDLIKNLLPGSALFPLY